MNRGDLATFLRTRRHRLRPADVGLPGAAGPRRTPGLRRQEVAQLAGISVDYYIRLEQARGPRPSRQVLSALARALLLTTDEREYLFRLADQSPPPAASPSREVSPGLPRSAASPACPPPPVEPGPRRRRERLPVAPAHDCLLAASCQAR
jgi:transcriptional regulator with XRE-family HTH domain